MQFQKTVAVLAAVLLVFGRLACAEDSASTLAYIESLPAPALMDGVGNSRLEISTDKKKAQHYFNQGVSLLHDFWWFEAYRSFRHASELDPDAAMPWWGRYLAARNMANLPDAERKAELQLAVDRIGELRDNASTREQYYLDSITASHGKDGDEGDAAYRAELEALLVAYPDEVEAKLFLWLALDGGFDADGRPRDGQVYGQLLLETELAKHPDHQGLLHYWIHNQESGKHPESALGAAERLASLAPNAGHIVHMPGHIHFRMGNYDAAHEQFALADDADARYMHKYGIDPIFTWNYLHNISFLVANLAEAGRFDEAREYARSFRGMANDSEYKNYEGYSMVSGRAELEPFLLELRSGNFALAAETLRSAPAQAGSDPDQVLRRAAYQAYADGMAAIQAGDPEVAGQAGDRLDALLWRAERDDVRLRGLKVMTIYSLELQAMVEHGNGDTDKAIELLGRALEKEAELRYSEPPPVVRPVAESLADIYLTDGDWEKAREAYSQVLGGRPNSGYALFGIARSFDLEGDADEARSAYRRFLDAWASADADAPRKQHAEAWLTANPG